LSFLTVQYNYRFFPPRPFGKRRCRTCGFDARKVRHTEPIQQRTLEPRSQGAAQSSSAQQLRGEKKPHHRRVYPLALWEFRNGTWNFVGAGVVSLFGLYLVFFQIQEMEKRLPTKRDFRPVGIGESSLTFCWGFVCGVCGSSRPRWGRWGSHAGRLSVVVYRPLNRHQRNTNSTVPPLFAFPFRVRSALRLEAKARAQTICVHIQLEAGVCSPTPPPPRAPLGQTNHDRYSSLKYFAFDRRSVEVTKVTFWPADKNCTIRDSVAWSRK